MAQPFWDGAAGLNDEAWNFVWLGGMLLPGVSVVTAPMKRSIEKKKAKGTDGTTITDQGDELTELKISTKVYSAEQWSQWQQILPLLWAKKAGAVRTPLEIIHPLSAALGISDVYLDSLNVQPPESQVMVIELGCFDWSPSVRALADAINRQSSTRTTPTVATNPAAPPTEEASQANADTFLNSFFENARNSGLPTVA